MPQRDRTRTGFLAASLLTPFAFAVAGYHPFVEDGGVYAAGIERLLNPALFPAWTAFVTEHLRFSLFAPLVADIVRTTHLSLAWTLLLLYVLGIWTTLFAAWLLAARLTASAEARLAAMALLACWLTLPIAGTSLMLMDPYVTARSFTTPLALLALAWAVDFLQQFLGFCGLGTTADRSASLRDDKESGYSDRGYSDRGDAKHLAWLPCAFALALAAALHPLMAGYAVAAIACLAAVETKTLRLPILLAAAAVAAAAILQFVAPAEPHGYRCIAITRYYWFPAEWHWYELLGLVAPLSILFAMRRRGTEAQRTVAEGAILLGAIALLIALLFAHESYATHLVARMQPLRAFQIVYEIMILLLGAWLGTHLLKHSAWRWAAFLVVLGTPMFYAQRATFPNSAHIEWPNAQPANPWEQAFVWIRANTPTDALVALDARYISRGKHEDAQCFRAIAERSALPDYSKDGGEASITPALTSGWALGEAAQTGLEGEPDAMRESRLKPLGVTWAVLESESQTDWNCPYSNPTVKVCRIP